MFESKLVRLADYSEMKITDDIRVTPMGDKEINAILDKLAKRSVVTTEGEMIEKGDLTILDLRSHTVKFNKRNFPLTVGLGLFNTELENQIIGMNKGENRLLRVNGNEVLVKIKTISRRIPAKITDDIILTLNIDGVNNVSDYREHLINKDLKEKRMRIICKEAIDFVLDNSEYSISENDISLLYEKNIIKLYTYADIKKMTLDELAKIYYGTTVEELKHSNKEAIPNSIKYMLIGMEYVKENNNLQIDEEKYEMDIKDEAETRMIPFKDVKRLNPYELFIINKYKEIVSNTIYNYYKKEICGK